MVNEGLLERREREIREGYNFCEDHQTFHKDGCRHCVPCECNAPQPHMILKSLCAFCQHALQAAK